MKAEEPSSGNDKEPGHRRGHGSSTCGNRPEAAHGEQGGREESGSSLCPHSWSCLHSRMLGQTQGRWLFLVPQARKQTREEEPGTSLILHCRIGTCSPTKPTHSEGAVTPLKEVGCHWETILHTAQAKSINENKCHKNLTRNLNIKAIGKRNGSL